MGILGSIIGGLGSIFGADKANKANAREAKLNREMQMDLAKNTIKYRTADAKASGIHPLYAVGAPSMSMSPVMSGQSNAYADGASQIGTGINKAMNLKYEKQVQAKNLEALDAEINLKNAQATNYIEEAKRNSNMAMMQQIGRTAGNDTLLKTAGGGTISTKGLTPSEDFEKFFGSAGEIYGLENLVHKLIDLSPKAMETLKLKYGGPKPSYYNSVQKKRYKQKFNPYWFR